MFNNAINSKKKKRRRKKTKKNRNVRFKNIQRIFCHKSGSILSIAKLFAFKPNKLINRFREMKKLVAAESRNPNGNRFKEIISNEVKNRIIPFDNGNKC